MSDGPAVAGHCSHRLMVLTLDMPVTRVSYLSSFIDCCELSADNRRCSSSLFFMMGTSESNIERQMLAVRQPSLTWGCWFGQASGTAADQRDISGSVELPLLANEWQLEARFRGRLISIEPFITFDHQTELNADLTVVVISSEQDASHSTFRTAARAIMV